MAVVLVLLLAGLSAVTANLDDALRSYETLHSIQFTHRIVKRDLTSGTPTVRQVEFDSLGRHFHLHLQKKERLLASGFKVVGINAKNEEREVDIKDSYPYEGHVVGEEDSEVHAVWEDEENMAASITTKGAAIFVEPSWRHLPHSDNYTMIVYRKEDVKNDQSGNSFCGFINATEDLGLPEPPPSTTNDNESRKKGHRSARDAGSTPFFTPVHTTCQVVLVADYLFFKNMAASKLSRTTSYLIGLLDRVDAIYRKTDFGNGYTGMGFEIKEIRIHEEFTENSGLNPPHFNVDVPGGWETKTKLEAFSRDPTLSKFCLGHLFTYQAFKGGVLGLAYIGSARKYSLGGICSPDYYKNKARLYLNTGWSSGLNHHNRRLLTQEADLVTTHEFGHNWGSQHDPDTKECAPSAFDGGKHIMYTYSVSGYDANNKLFSPCSRRSIGQVLAKKSNSCFSAKRQSFCGNMLVETPMEECDVGPAGQKDKDPCCDKNCKLRPTAKCSDVNDLCCKSCQFAPATHRCQEAASHIGTCEGEAYCTGKNASCPPPEKKTNGSPCLERGECREGKCVPFCEGKGQVSCICDKVETSCMWCCKQSSNSSCEPYQDLPSVNMTALPNGMPCVWGSCDEGICVKETQELVQRFWSIIDNITPDRIGAFMRANLVGTVIILSLIIWIPVSCIIGWQDRKAEEREKERPPANAFYRPGQEERVRQGRRQHRRQDIQPPY